MKVLIASAVLVVAVFSAAPAAAADLGSWQLDSNARTKVAPGGTIPFLVKVINFSPHPTTGQIEVRAQLPSGMSAVSASIVLPASGFSSFVDIGTCAAGNSVDPVAGASEVLCTTTETIEAQGPLFHYFFVRLNARADEAAAGTATVSFDASGGGLGVASTVDPTEIDAAPTPFGVDAFDNSPLGADGKFYAQAGGHPDDFAASLDFTRVDNPTGLGFETFPVEGARKAVAHLPPGLVGNPQTLDTCTAAQLANGRLLISRPLCPPTAQVGVATVRLPFATVAHMTVDLQPIYNLVPPPGVAARFGFNTLGNVVVLDASVRSDGDYGLDVTSSDITESLAVVGSTLHFWGLPSSDSHDGERSCPGLLPVSQEGVTCDSGSPPRPFFRMPTSCAADPGSGLPVSVDVESWLGHTDATTIHTHEAPGYPYAPEDWGDQAGIQNCDKVPVKGKLQAQPTTIDAESSSGLQVEVEVPNPGLENPEGIASSDIKAVKVALPKGMTINPSQAEGLGVCTPAQYASTELSFHPTPGKGCPDDSKIGSVVVHTQLLEEAIEGDVYIAAPYDNPFHSLLALYVVLHNPERGILIKLPGEVRTNETTGQIETEFDDLPQLPFEDFKFHFREGARAPLVTPPTCGRYTTETQFTPWSNPSSELTSLSSFEIVRGIGGGSCPAGGTPPFRPGFSAGSLNPTAGAYSPFLMRLTRNDGEQDLTKFSSILPPGVAAKIAGVSKCPDAAIAAAKSKTGLGEKASPSCPASSRIGRTMVGAGVGSVLTYVPGSLYLGGPYNGAPLSVVSITPAVAGPFDVGTVVVQEALTLDPRTGEVHVDGDRSDPIPHILKGIPLKVRDVRVYVDRPDFTINPTSCDASQVGATLFGSAADVFNPADDVPVSLSSRFQAASCAGLGFKPKLALKLKGGTRRGAHPALTAVLRPRPGDANLADAVVTLPHSAFLDQAHIRTVCTRVQYAAGGGQGRGCPPGSVYGHVRAFTPLLDEPLEGPAYLRSSNHQLPDLVFALHGVVDIEAVGRIDSSRGGLRASFEGIPDAPLSKAVIRMQGAKKGLIVNSRNLCASRNRADVRLTAQSGKPYDSKTAVTPDCGGKARTKHGRR